jgi:internalin A
MNGFITGIIFFILLMTQAVSGQTVVLPDTNLRNKLITDYPQVMQAGKLLTAKAAALTGALNINNANIKDATGIEYFININFLNIAGNLLRTIPDISGTKNLMGFYANNNQLTSLPSMAFLTQLGDFQVSYNQLTSLPDISGASGLKFLYCSNNRLSQFPSLKQFPALSILVMGENPLKGVIDFSLCPNLTQLHVHKTGIDTIIGLRKLTKLNILYAWGNNIRSFSGLDSITTLTTIFIFDNPIKDLPFLSNKPGLKVLEVVNCNLSFEDIIPVLQHTAPSTFNYVPQRSIPINDISSREKNKIVLPYPEPLPHPGNIYVWVKNGLVIDSSKTASLTFNSLSYSDSGKYTLKVYNPSVPGLIMNSGVFGIEIKPCLEFSLPMVTILDKQCGKGYKIDISNAVLSGGNPPFSYALSNGIYNEHFTSLVYENIPAGNFLITVTDAKKCTASSKFVLSQIEKCDPVITPNGDGVSDSYFIEKHGKVKIYDLHRNLVNSLDGPSVWDATDQKGALLDTGYYILIIDEDPPIYVSIIR